jgi:multicomponent Na+:H+ antiporter subunit G
MITAGLVLLSIGSALLALAGFGVWRLPDALSRQHAATKSGTLALAFVCLGAALVARDLDWALRLAVVVAFLLATLPLSSNVLARAALREADGDEAGRDARLVDPPRR